MKHLKRLRALVAVLRHRPIEVSSPLGDFNLFLDDRLVLPVIRGGAPKEGEEGGDGGEEEGGDGGQEGEPDGGQEGEEESGDDGKQEEGGDDEGEEEGEEGQEGKPDVDWKKMARKHEAARKSAERKLKREQRDRKKLEEDAKKRADAEKSEHEKALDKARDEGKQEALSASEKERRKDRLEVAVTRIASKGVEVGEGDEAKTVRFADPEDAQVFLDRAIANGDADEEDIFADDGKVNSDAVREALVTILEERPRLAAEFKPRPSGSADGGKGKGGTKDLADLTVEEHFQRIRRNK